MTIHIAFPSGACAALRDGVWQSANTELLTELAHLTTVMGSGNQDPDRLVAEEVALKLGGGIIAVDPA